MPRLTAGGNRAILEPYGRIFPGTSMSTSDGLTSPGDLSFRGRKRSSFFLVLAAGLLLFAAVVGAVAIMRKNVVVLWVPTGPARRAQRKEGKSRIKAIEDLAGHRVGVVGRMMMNAAPTTAANSSNPAAITRNGELFLFRPR